MSIKKKIKRVRKTTLKNKAYALFSQAIRKKGYCELKGLDNITCASSLQTMHIIGRGNLSLRYDKKNALCGCQGHHVWYTNHALEFYELIRTKFPERYKYLMKAKNKLSHNLDYEKLIEELSV